MNYEEMSIPELRRLLAKHGMEDASSLSHRDLVDAACKLHDTDYDDAGRKLLANQLNLQPNNNSKGRNNLDPIWRHSETGAYVYVGNYMAASTRKILLERNITAVVNCQDESSKNYFEKSGDDDSEEYDDDDETLPTISYHRFVIQKLSFLALQHTAAKRQQNGNQKFLQAFLPTFEFIDEHLASGRCVLVHCLAGAHQAGTTGVAFLMYKVGLCKKDAIAAAKRCRPAINPFATLLILLSILDQELKEQREEAVNE